MFSMYLQVVVEFLYKLGTEPLNLKRKQKAENIRSKPNLKNSKELTIYTEHETL